MNLISLLILIAFPAVGCTWLVCWGCGLTVRKVWTRVKEIVFMYVLSTTFNRENLRVAEGTRWSQGCLFNADGGISIGKNVLIGPHVIIHSSNHVYSDPEKPIKQQGQSCKSVIIEDDCWIGANSVILAGVHLGYGVVVGAGSVVTHNVPAYCVVVGNPAHIIKVRGGKETLRFRDVLHNYLKNQKEETIVQQLVDKDLVEVYH